MEKKTVSLQKHEVLEYTLTTGFSEKEIKNILKIYLEILNDKNMIDFESFCNKTGYPTSSELVRRIFTVMDSNKDDQLNFDELLYSLDSTINGDLLDKIKFMYHICGKGGPNITNKDLIELINDIKNTFPTVIIPKEVLENMIQNCFDAKRSISFDLGRAKNLNYGTQYRENNVNQDSKDLSKPPKTDYENAFVPEEDEDFIDDTKPNYKFFEKNVQKLPEKNGTNITHLGNPDNTNLYVKTPDNQLRETMDEDSTEKINMSKKNIRQPCISSDDFVELIFSSADQLGYKDKT